MKPGEIIKRLYNDYSKKFLGKIFLAGLFSIMVAGATSSIAWLLDPAIKKIFIDKDEKLIFLIPALIIITFTAKGVSLYFAKSTMISVAEEIKKLPRPLCTATHVGAPTTTQILSFSLRTSDLITPAVAIYMAPCGNPFGFQYEI